MGVLDPPGLALAQAGHLLGRTAFNPSIADNKNVSSSTPILAADARRDLGCDFFAPTSGSVRVTFDGYIKNVTTGGNEYAGVALALSETEISGSRRLMNRRGTASGSEVEERVLYEHVVTGLTAGASYTVIPMLYSNSGFQVTLQSGAAFGPSVTTVYAAASAPNPLSHTYTQNPATATSIVADSKYNSFAGACLAANGNIVGAYRQATAHTSGGLGIQAIVSSNSGSTWGSPYQIIDGGGVDDFGTASLTLLSDNRIALTTWRRPAAGGNPYVNGTRIYFSSNNGATFPSYITPDTGSWLTRYSVSEAPLLEYGSAWYLGVWGEDSTDTSGYYQAGVLRSTNSGSTWTRVALFKDLPTAKYNEIGLAVVGSTFVAVIRDEVAIGLWVSTSTNGTSWTSPVFARGVSVGAPKLVTISGVAYWPARYGQAVTSTTGLGYLAGTNGSQVWRASHLELSAGMIYGQAVSLGSGTIGVFHAGDTGSNVGNIYWSSFDVT